MEDSNNSNFLFLDEYESSFENDYMNNAKRNKSNIKKYDKFKSRDFKSKIQNDLKDEESKLKMMLYSLLECEAKENKESKISENNKLKNFDILSPIKKIILRKDFQQLLVILIKIYIRKYLEIKRKSKK